MKRKFVIAAVTAAVLVGGTAATAVAFADDDSHDRQARSSVKSGDTARTDVAQAVAAAVRAVPGTVTEAELDDEDGGLVWELDVYGSDKVWHDVTVDAGNGKVLGKHTSDDDGDDDRDRYAPRSAPVSLNAAVDAALKANPGTVTSVDLDDNDDRSGKALHWEVDVRGKDGKKHELNVDAKSGKVTVDRSDDDHGDDDRDGDDD
ncbi:PepSY domain-containing protein [Streptomyces sp. NBC_00257]|uniref:PepSY domain-containing protein n=1 Tax=unclassified Streptomyces TaxID=2593676 RepID=UPI00224EE0E2|nr:MULTISPECIES: PepSY domain-containing protein [unclassified Streptomyces]MCX4864413.1 PepSY domain-containing protein [Streptomyces sp. NBC_00906]MCX4895651.1 PepSY domain-containing protein [Streptomyces sp. NBC_00892]MCX5428939.1 PepSY domain-containing protein [Streptomyces sp. NBC_00062]